LTAVVTGSIAPVILKHHSIRKVQAPYWPDPIADPLGPRRNPKALTAASNHFRHERQALEVTLIIQRPKDLLRASDLNEIASLQFLSRHCRDNSGC
jgi:hypothetical protein